MYVPEHLERWRLPKYYFGQEWPEYYSAGVGRSRDSDCGEESNFDAMLQGLGGESATVQVVRESHFLCGWVEWIAIHESDEVSLRAADAARGDLNDYPILDENDYSERETEHCEQVWRDCYRWRERLKYLRTHSHTGEFPQLLEAVRGDWHAAANVLHCPSDLVG